MTPPRVAPWQVWWVDFNPQLGREQAGRRPAIVVGSSLACGLPNGLAIVVPMTTRNRGLPFHPAVQLGETTGYAMTDQIKSISTQRLKKPHPDQLVSEDVQTVKFALRRMLDL
ncbi:type II toxin-antitoxin system PemK/MazF family toxin [Kribbella caucasensis]|uniref:type II toxin-antitoxin system PemK/MazF family toxin n=1 Tax=Kribbella caucasensis TaxID=2512215 RepID=UPI001EDE4099|nr:type II toxin-antitoxin system PemK/MazF family toxin [Kribbella sp. VKM Ac-2527]